MQTVLSASLNSNGAPHIEILEAAGFEVRILPEDVNRFDEDKLISYLHDCVAVSAGAEPYTERVIAAAPQLRVIARTGVGYDAVDLKACDEAGIVVTTTPGVNHHAVAEQTIALLFGVALGFPELDRRVREKQWKRMAFPRVMGSTLGLVGLGNIGQAVVTRAVGLGMKVLAVEPAPVAEFAKKWNVELTNFDDLLARSDFVSLHAPLLPETKHMMNAKTLEKMKQGSILINTARGGLIDEHALYDAVKSGHLRGAGLDVFEVEPLPLDSPLLELDNVLLSCHVAGLDRESWYDTFVMLAETIVALREGRWPVECIRNLEGVTNWRWDRE